MDVRRVIIMHPCEIKVGGDGTCSVAVPAVVGLGRSAAAAMLAEAGFGVSVVEISTDDSTLDGVVESYSPSGVQILGAPIELRVWKWVEG